MEDCDFDLYLETSAKNGHNVEKLFIEACKLLYKEYLNTQSKMKKKKIDNNNNNLVLEQKEKEPKKKENCHC